MNELDIISTLELETNILLTPEMYPTTDKLNQVLKADLGVQKLFDKYNVNIQKVKIPIRWMTPEEEIDNTFGSFLPKENAIILSTKRKINSDTFIHEMDHWLRKRVMGEEAWQTPAEKEQEAKEYDIEITDPTFEYLQRPEEVASRMEELRYKLQEGKTKDEIIQDKMKIFKENKTYLESEVKENADMLARIEELLKYWVIKEDDSKNKEDYEKWREKRETFRNHLIEAQDALKAYQEKIDENIKYLLLLFDLIEEVPEESTVTSELKNDNKKIEVGDIIKSILHKNEGTVLKIAPKTKGGTVMDVDYAIEWDEPLFGNKHTEVHPTEIELVRKGPKKTAAVKPNCTCFDDEWNTFTNNWYEKIVPYLSEKLGSYLGRMSGKVIPLTQDHIDADINGMYDPRNGDIYLRPEAAGQTGYLLITLLHEITHANLGELYTGPFYSEGQVDFLDEVLCDDSFWGNIRQLMIDTFIASNKKREKNYLERPTQFNSERWRGQEWARQHLGNNIVQCIKNAKEEWYKRLKLNASLKVISATEAKDTPKYKIGDLVDCIHPLSYGEVMSVYGFHAGQLYYRVRLHYKNHYGEPIDEPRFVVEGDLFPRGTLKESPLGIISANEIEIPSRFKSVVDKIKTVASELGIADKTYIVGGFVRDLLLKREPKDIDVIVEIVKGGQLLAEAISKKYDLKPPAIFEKFGTAQLNIDGEQVEFGTTRKEYYFPESRKPEVVFGTLDEDAERRDFTVNSLYIRLSDMQLLDPTGRGLKDLKEKKMSSAYKDVDKMISDDPLRMLRGIRQSLQLGFEIDPVVTEAIKKNVDRMGIISGGRIGEELKKILETSQPSKGIRFLRDTDLLKYVVPGLEKTYQVEQPTQYHSKDVFEHILKVVDNIPNDVVLRLSALLHDIGKPATKSIVDNTIHFFNHENISADMASVILKKLQFPPEMVQQVTFNVREHMRPHGAEQWSDAAVRRFIRDMGVHLNNVLQLAEADVTSARIEKIEKSKEQINTLRKRIEEEQTKQDVTKIPEILDGYELMDLFKKEPGKWIKQVKEYLLDKQMENPNITKDEAKELVRQFVKDQNLFVESALTKEEAVYPGMMWVSELSKFYDTATKEQKDELERLLNENKIIEAKTFIAQTLDMNLAEVKPFIEKQPETEPISITDVV